MNCVCEMDDNGRVINYCGAHYAEIRVLNNKIYKFKEVLRKIQHENERTILYEVLVDRIQRIVDEALKGDD